MPEPDLAGRRILVVEDEPMLAIDIVDQIETHNGIVLGPMATLEQGFAGLRQLQPDAAILNIRLGPFTVYDLADKLLEEGIPFIFASGEQRADIPERFKDVPLHGKPVDMVKVAACLITHGGKQAEG